MTIDDNNITERLAALGDLYRAIDDFSVAPTRDNALIVVRYVCRYELLLAESVSDEEILDSARALAAHYGDLKDEISGKLSN